MPDEAFLEQYALYRKFSVEEMPSTMDGLPRVRIKMACPACNSEQTFAMTNEYWEHSGYVNTPLRGKVIRMVYLCGHCQEFERVFYVKADESGEWFMKVGQYPAWDISGDLEVERLLGEHASLYKKGLICESQAYGLASFAYYRRIVEEVIDDLLDEISGLIGESELPMYEAALEKTKSTTVTQEKIELVKDLLPPILRPDGTNPLTALHSALSEGLHAGADEDCLEQAAVVRDILVYFVNQVARTRAASREFTDSMRKLLDRKSGRSG